MLRGRVIRSAGYTADADPDVDNPLFEVRQDWRAHLDGVTVTPRLVERREDHLDGAPTAWRSTITRSWPARHRDAAPSPRTPVRVSAPAKVGNQPKIRTSPVYRIRTSTPLILPAQANYQVSASVTSFGALQAGGQDRSQFG